MKLKVGDLELDSQSSVSVAEPPRTSLSRAEDDTAHGAQRAAALFGACAAAIGFAGFLGALLVSSWFSILAGLGVVLSFGSFVTYFLIGWDERGKGDAEASATGADTALEDVRRQRVMVAVQDAATVDELVDRLGWSQSIVLKTLKQLVERGELEEDLELQTGVWVYRPPTTLLLDERPLNTLNLEDRIEAINESQPQPSKVK